MIGSSVMSQWPGKLWWYFTWHLTGKGNQQWKNLGEQLAPGLMGENARGALGEALWTGREEWCSKKAYSLTKWEILLAFGARQNKEFEFIPSTMEVQSKF